MIQVRNGCNIIIGLKHGTSYIVNNAASPNSGKPVAKNKYPDNFGQVHWSMFGAVSANRKLRFVQCSLKDLLIRVEA